MSPRAAALSLVLLAACGDPAGGGGQSPADESAAPASSAQASTSAGAAPRVGAPAVSAADLALKGASKRLVAKELQQDVLIELHVTQSIAPPEYVRALTDLLGHYRSAEHTIPGGGTSQSRVQFRVIDVRTASDEQEAKRLGLTETALAPWSPEPPPVDAPMIDLRRGYLGLVFKAGAIVSALPALPPCDPKTLEFFITNKLREIEASLSGRIFRFGVVVGKGELGLDEPNLAVGGNASMAAVVAGYFSYYVLQGVDLAGGEREIDPTLQGLIVLQPSADYSEAELRRIDEFVMRGGKALTIAASGGTLRASDPTMSTTLSTHGLDKLLTGYGLGMSPGLVYDHDGALELDATSRSGARIKLRHPGIPVVSESRLDRSFPVFFNAKDTAFPLASGLTLSPSAQPDAKLTALARTSRGAAISTELGASMRLAESFPRSGETGERVLAASLEGTIRSAFDKSERSRSPSRVLMLASSHVFANPFARAANPPPLPPQLATMGPQPADPELSMIAYPYTSIYSTRAILTFKRTLDWMSGESDFAEVDLPLTEPKR